MNGLCVYKYQLATQVDRRQVNQSNDKIHNLSLKMEITTQS
jgi:hypothetical protein